MCSKSSNDNNGGILRQKYTLCQWLRLSLVFLFLIAIIFHYGVELLFRRAFPVHASGIVLISGTSTGIGRATCGFLAEKYSSITFYCGVRKSTVASTYPFTLDNVSPVILDITKDRDVQKIMSKVQQSGKPLIGLVNNAGVQEGGIAEFQPLESVQWMFDVNVFGTYRLTQAALPLLRQAKGRVVIASSVIARTTGTPREGVYTGSKKALEAFGDSLRQQLDYHDVSVSIMEPGILASEMVNGMLQQGLDAQQQDISNEEKQIYPNIYQPEIIEIINQILRVPGDMDETCRAFDDALFGKYPKSRYITSYLGPLPSWLAAKVFDILPERILTALLPERLYALITFWQ